MVKKTKIDSVEKLLQFAEQTVESFKSDVASDEMYLENDRGLDFLYYIRKNGTNLLLFHTGKEMCEQDRRWYYGVVNYYNDNVAKGLVKFVVFRRKGKYYSVTTEEATWIVLNYSTHGINYLGIEPAITARGEMCEVIKGVTAAIV